MKQTNILRLTLIYHPPSNADGIISITVRHLAYALIIPTKRGLVYVTVKSFLSFLY